MIMKLEALFLALVVVLINAMFCIPATSVWAESNYAEVWVSRYDGVANDFDSARAMCLDQSGNVYVTGASVGTDTSHDFVTIKYDGNGVQQWVARYNGPADDTDVATGVCVDSEGNVYVAGNSMGISTNYDYATIKYDSDGVKQWVARYVAPGAGNDTPYALAVDDSGNVYVTGASVGTMFDYATVKYGSDGVEQWVARYNGPANGEDMARGLCVDSSGNVYVAGSSTGVGSSFDYVTIKYDGNGVQQWVARYDGSANSSDVVRDFAMDNMGNIYVFGTSYNTGTGNDFCAIKYNSGGVEQWVALYNSLANGSDIGSALDVDESGNVYVNGQSESSCATVKYNVSGIEQWVARYNQPPNGYERPVDLDVDNSGDVYITGGFGYGNVDYATIKYDSDGVEQWVAPYDGPASDDDRSYALAVDGSGNVYVTGESAGSVTGFDYCTIKYSDYGPPSISPTEVEATLAPGEPGTILKEVFTGNDSFDTLTLQHEGLPDGWDMYFASLDSTPLPYTNVGPGSTLTFAETIIPWVDATPGDYLITIEVVGDGEVIEAFGAQTVIIHVPGTIEYIDQQIVALSIDISASGSPQGTRKSLSNKLGTVAVSKENGNYCAAVNKIEHGFFGALDAQYNAGHVSEEDYASWRDAANYIKSLLQELCES